MQSQLRAIDARSRASDAIAVAQLLSATHRELVETFRQLCFYQSSGGMLDGLTAL